jgi:hypothetical protein
MLWDRHKITSDTDALYQFDKRPRTFATHIKPKVA